MQTIHTHRIASVALAAVFCLFNIGLPIIVAACPMAGDGAARLSCCAVKENAAVQRLVRFADRSCCKTTVAAERNTTEFVPSSPASSDHALLVPIAGAMVMPDVSFDLPLLHAVDPRCEPPPLPSADIPIFGSSLLI